MTTIPEWFPSHAPIYDITRSYDENAQDGPFFFDDLKSDGDDDGGGDNVDVKTVMIPKRRMPNRDQWVDFLGFKVATPIGIPAGPLLNSRWIARASQLGFDILTYKTIRSLEHPGHPLPNVVYVDTLGPLTLDRIGSTIPMRSQQLSHKLMTMQDLAITNSFGMPSKNLEFLRQDIARANADLDEGQILIVSVVGTPPSETITSTHDRGELFFEDFVTTARFARDAGAKVIEANFSCPNVATGEGSIFTNPESVFNISSRIVRAIGPHVPLIIKVGAFVDQQVMRKVLLSAARAGVQAIHGINTLSMKVVETSTGQPALGPNRLTSGICGAPIRDVALDFQRAAHSIIQQEHLNLQVLGCGGITLPHHFDDFLQTGCIAAMSATGFMWDPLLALRYHQQHSR